MIRVYFQEIRTGRLGRLQYLGYSLFLLAIAFLAMLSVVATSTGWDALWDLSFPQIDKAFERAIDRFGIVPFIPMFVLAFVDLNIQAKRLRDIGLPGWPAIVGILGVYFAISTLLWPLSDIFAYLVWIALLLTPSDFVRTRTGEKT